MAVFRSPAKQAASVMRELQGSHLKSVGMHIPADHEHRFRFNVNTISGPM